MADRIRIGIVGATLTTGGSGWGANAHIPALHALPEFEIKAVCTAHEDTAKAAAAAFGAELAFRDINDMVAHPDIDVVVVCVRVPLHHQLVMPALRAGKPVFCEWPLGANLAEAREMADLARGRGLRTQVGLQGRGDATLAYVRDLIADGHIGEVLSANLSITGQALTERGSGRLWQAIRANGANPLTIQGGHSIDAMCFVLGEVADVSARVATRITRWRNVDSGEDVEVDAPDTVNVAGRFESGAELGIQIATVPHGSTGQRLEIFGRDGFLVLTGASLQIGPTHLYGAGKGEAPAELVVPDRYTVVPEGTPTGQPRNVAQGYARLADGFRGGEPFSPDFDLAVRRHQLLAAIERSSEEGRAVIVATV